MFFWDVAPVYSKRNSIYENQRCVYKIMDRDVFFKLKGKISPSDGVLQADFTKKYQACVFGVIG